MLQTYNTQVVFKNVLFIESKMITFFLLKINWFLGNYIKIILKSYIPYGLEIQNTSYYLLNY